MKNIWKRFIELVFPGSCQEYLEDKKIHCKEIKKHQNN